MLWLCGVAYSVVMSLTTLALVRTFRDEAPEDREDVRALGQYLDAAAEMYVLRCCDVSCV